MKTITTRFLPSEAWYGLCTEDGGQMPITEGSDYRRCLEPNPTVNQGAPLFVSSLGRYIWCEPGMTICCSSGTITASSRWGEPLLSEGHQTLRGAFLAAAAAHFPPSGKMPPEVFFAKPQYNTWIELGYNQTQEKILEYAEHILAEGYPAGILMIDDGWNESYGTLEFKYRSFPDPEGMITRLHSLGFKIMLWVCPFISADTPVGRRLAEQGLLVKEENGETAIKHWWNGYSSVLDLSNPAASDWFCEQLDSLVARYGVDGFKFDAGDPYFYNSETDHTFLPITENGQSAAWAVLGSRYPYNEFRACYASAGLPLVQRLQDKCHAWDETGLAALLPNQLSQGIQGYAYTCPDMIGGGMLGSFLNENFSLDEELFVRYAQAAALSPMMQFSAAPWRVLSPENNRRCLAAACLHSEFYKEIRELALHASVTDEPIFRYMEYVFPHQGLESVTDQFMLGDTLLVAPVLTKGDRKRDVRLPSGLWETPDGARFIGGKTVTVPVDMDTLPRFRLICTEGEYFE